MYTDGSKRGDPANPRTMGCGSGWAVYRQGDSEPLNTGSCSLGKKAEVFDAELHAVQEGLLSVKSTHSQPTHITICVDNQAALTTLNTGNPENWEFARNTLQTMTEMRATGWTMSGLCTPGHCGIPGNDLADRLAKRGAFEQPCNHTRATKSWLYAEIQKKQVEDWKARAPADPQFPVRPSTKFPDILKKLSPTSTRALFQLQTATTLSDPHPSKRPEDCTCGAPLTSKHVLMDCKTFADARMEIFNPKTGGHLIKVGDNRFNADQTKAMLTFMRRTGLGFSRVLRDRLEDSPEEVQDWEVGEPGTLLMDLRI